MASDLNSGAHQVSRPRRFGPETGMAAKFKEFYLTPSIDFR
jgi:hypothetical protein